MDSKHDKNNQLRPLEDRQVPPELQWENMEAGILRKMEELQAATPAVAKKRRRRWGLVVLLLLIGILIPALFLWTGRSSTVVPPTGAAASQSVPATETNSGSNIDKVRNTPQTRAEVSELANNSQLATKARVDAEQSIERQSFIALDLGQDSNVTSQEEVEVVAGGRQSVSSSAPITGTPLKSIVEEDNRRGLTELIETEGSVDRSNSEIDATELREDDYSLVNKITQAEAISLAIVDQLPRAGTFQPVVSQDDQVVFELPVEALTSDLRCPAFGTQPAQIWLSGGASWWSPGYGETQPERAAFEEAILSYQGQFSYVRPLKKGMIFLAGLQYQQLESRLNWSTTLEDYEITLEDTIIQIQRNALTGEETIIRGDVTLTVPSERRVQHFNSFHVFQIPLAIGKSWGSGKLQSHVLVGGVANVSFSQAGRTLYQAELLDYDDSSTGIWSDEFGFSAMLSTGLRYQLTSRVGLITNLQYQYSLTNWSVEENIRMRPSILNWSFGASYSL